MPTHKEFQERTARLWSKRPEMLKKAGNFNLAKLCSKCGQYTMRSHGSYAKCTNCGHTRS